MSDQKLRDLERRWRETGAPSDEGALLRERLRLGVLTQERLDLAVHCDHPAALMAIPGSKEVADDLVWLRCVLLLGEREAAIRAACAIAIHYLPFIERHWMSPKSVTWPRMTIRAIACWHDCPCDGQPRSRWPLPCNQHVRSRRAGSVTWWLTRLHDKREEIIAWQPTGLESQRMLAAVQTCLIAAQVTRGFTHGEIGRSLELFYGIPFLERMLSAHMRGVMSAQLIRWALGYGDQLQEFLTCRPRRARK